MYVCMYVYIYIYKIQSISHKSERASIRAKYLLLLYGEIEALYCKNQSKYIDGLGII